MAGGCVDVAGHNRPHKVGGRLEEPDEAVGGADLLDAQVLGQQQGHHEEPATGANAEEAHADGYLHEGGGRGEEEGGHPGHQDHGRVAEVLGKQVQVWK